MFSGVLSVGSGALIVEAGVLFGPVGILSPGEETDGPFAGVGLGGSFAGCTGSAVSGETTLLTGSSLPPLGGGGGAEGAEDVAIWVGAGAGASGISLAGSSGDSIDAVFAAGTGATDVGAGSAGAALPGSAAVV